MVERRGFLKASLTAGLAGVAAISRAGRVNAAPRDVTFVLVHGSWHGASCWDEVKQPLIKSGHNVIAIDLPGHGNNARSPKGYDKRPLDFAAFSTAKSPVANIGLQSYVQAVKNAVSNAKKNGAKRIVVVAHSMGGVPLTFAAEDLAKDIHAMVFVTACMMPPSTPYVTYSRSPSQAGEKSSALLLADPTVINALRWDPRSPDDGYRASIRAALFNDVSESVMDSVLKEMTPDSPFSIFFDPPNNLTEEGYGSIKRFFIRCGNDFTIRPQTQDAMIRDLNSAYPNNKTKVLRVDSGHEVMFSRPQQLARLLATAAR